MNISGVATEAGLDSLVDAVLTTSRVLVAIAARSLSDAGEQVTLTQYRALVVLASRGQQSLGDLAEALSVTPPTASRMCDRLVKRGLVRRRTDRRDRRAVRVALTGSGRELVDAVTARRRVEIADLLGSVEPEVQQSVVIALHQLCESAGEVPEHAWSTGWEL
jgi:DNA-binding MarR family transcriptional regulator